MAAGRRWMGRRGTKPFFLATISRRARANIHCTVALVLSASEKKGVQDAAFDLIRRSRGDAVQQPPQRAAFGFIDGFWTIMSLV